MGDFFLYCVYVCVCMYVCGVKKSKDSCMLFVMFRESVLSLFLVCLPVLLCVIEVILALSMYLFIYRLNYFSIHVLRLMIFFFITLHRSTLYRIVQHCIVSFNIASHTYIVN